MLQLNPDLFFSFYSHRKKCHKGNEILFGCTALFLKLSFPIKLSISAPVEPLCGNEKVKFASALYLVINQSSSYFRNLDS